MTADPAASAASRRQQSNGVRLAAVMRANELSVSVGAVRGGEWRRALVMHGGETPPLPCVNERQRARLSDSVRSQRQQGNGVRLAAVMRANELSVSVGDCAEKILNLEN